MQTSPAPTLGRVVYVNILVFAARITRTHPGPDRLRLQYRVERQNCTEITIARPGPDRRRLQKLTASCLLQKSPVGRIVYVYSIVLSTAIARSHPGPGRL